MNVIVENSTWNNIGDGFYQFSLYNLFRVAHPQWNVTMMDGPIDRAFRPSFFKRNAFHLNKWQTADLVVLSGPILGGEFVSEYGDIIRRTVLGGGRYCILSAHGNGDGLEKNLEILKAYPPVAFSSRDTPTFEMYGKVSKHSFDGVCAAFLVSETCSVAPIDSNKKYITVSFYETFEPRLKLEGGEVFPDLEGRLLERDRRWKWKRHLECLRRSQANVGEYEIVRPVHDIYYKFPHLNFSSKNKFLSFNPLSYLSLYKHTSLTVSNRVHSVLPTLSFGRPAIYFGSTKRNALFKRLGVDSFIGTKLCVTSSLVRREYEAMLQFVSAIPVAS